MKPRGWSTHGCGRISENHLGEGEQWKYRVIDRYDYVYMSIVLYYTVYIYIYIRICQRIKSSRPPRLRPLHDFVVRRVSTPEHTQAANLVKNRIPDLDNPQYWFVLYNIFNIHTYIYLYIYIDMRIYIYIQLYIYMHSYVFEDRYIYICIHTYITLHLTTSHQIALRYITVH